MSDELLRVAVFSGVLSLLAYVPYLLDIYSGQTRPLRSSWLIWSTLTSISLLAQIDEGASLSLWFAVAQTVGTISIFLVSIRRGMGGLLTRKDGPILAIALVGVLLWTWTDSAIYALILSIAVSLVAGFAAALKALQHPETETMLKWVISCLRVVLGYRFGRERLIGCCWPIPSTSLF